MIKNKSDLKKRGNLSINQKSSWKATFQKRGDLLVLIKQVYHKKNLLAATSKMFSFFYIMII